jgi:hypothetical protein
VTLIEELRRAGRAAATGLPFRWDAATIERGLNFTLKRAAGRPKDFEVIAELEIIRDRGKP